MIDQGCTFAINLDGGGSSQFSCSDGRNFATGRACPAWLAIWYEKDETPQKESSFQPIKCRCTAKTYTLNSSGLLEGNRYIDPGDICNLNTITTNCLIEIAYPTSKGLRTAYIKSLDNF